MQSFRIYTLVDITRTNIQKENVDILKKKQQDNYHTLLQSLEMRTNIVVDTDPFIQEMDWRDQGYGDKEKTWVWNISTEQDDVFLNEGDPVGFMISGIDFVPFISDCTESADFKKNYFSTKIKPVNILFNLIDKYSQ